MNAIAAAVLSMALLAQLAARDDVAPKRMVVIVAPTSTLTNISLGDLRRTYLGALTRWPNGRRIVPVVLRAETREQRAFLKRVVQLTDIDYAQHWIGEVFRGRASGPPHVAATQADAVRFVATHPDAIAFVAAEAVDATVKPITVDGRDALEISSPVH